MRKARRAAGAAIAAGGAALGTTAGVLHLTATPAGAATITVDTTADGNDGECVVDCTLREAIDTAVSGDTINFGVNGTITLLGAYGGQLVVDKNLTISGPGAANLSVDGANSYRVFYIYDAATQLNVTISGITIQNGNNTGATRNDGGAIINLGENLTLTDVVMTGNDSVDDGGAVSNFFDGGTDPSLTVNGTSTFSNNYAAEDGGAFDFNGGSLSISGTTTITENDADSDGGGIFLYDSTTLSISGTTTISQNEAGSDGGGIGLYNFDSFSVTGATFSGNSAGDRGGGFYFYDQGSSTGSTITASVFSGNTATDDGGGAFFYGLTSLEIVNTTISGNTSGGNGGGIALYDTDSDVGGLTIRNSTISGNTATGAGGGLYLAQLNAGSVQVQNSTISGNTAASGGAIFLYGPGYDPIALVQSTITDNTSTGGGGGGIGGSAVGGAGAAAAEPRDADKPPRTEPKETSGTGAQQDVGALQTDEFLLVGTILAGNTGAPDLDDTTVTFISDHSLLGSVGAGVTVVDQGGTIFSTNPGLGPLANNGGPTQTHALLRASLAIDAGPTTLPAFTGNTFDQRGPGFARVFNGRVDIGAYELPVALRFPTFTG